jgi:hypothetical protein
MTMTHKTKTEGPCPFWRHDNLDTTADCCDRILVCYRLDNSSPVLCRLLCIHTIEGGHNSGRSTILLAETGAERDEWVKILKSQAKIALEEANRPEDLGFIRNLQRTCREIYSSNMTQYSIGVVTLFLSGPLRAFFNPLAEMRCH